MDLMNHKLTSILITIPTEKEYNDIKDILFKKYGKRKEINKRDNICGMVILLRYH